MRQVMTSELALYIVITLIGGGLFSTAGKVKSGPLKVVMLIIGIPMWLIGLFLSLIGVSMMVTYTNMIVLVALLVAIIAFYVGIRSRGNQRIFLVVTFGLTIATLVLEILKNNH
jgi:hypothetical protein